MDCLATKGAILILIYMVKTNKKVNYSLLDKNIPSAGKYAIQSAALCLIANGLLKERREQNFNQRLLTLTPIGRYIGEHLAKIPDMIDELI